MSEHTKEPWSVIAWDDESFSIHTENDDPVVHFGPDDLYDDARRIVACVNACAGMDDPAKEISTLKAQRDELALSLRKAALDFVNANGTIPSWWKDCVDIVKPILADKIESIANAERPAGC